MEMHRLEFKELCFFCGAQDVARRLDAFDLPLKVQAAVWSIWCQMKDDRCLRSAERPRVTCVESVMYDAFHIFVTLQITLPTGEVHHYVQRYIPLGVGALVRLEDGRFVVIENCRPRKAPGLYGAMVENVGGYVEPGESLKAAALRETLEESGVVAEESSCIFLGEVEASAYFIGGTTMFFIDNARLGKTSPDKDEFISRRIVSAGELEDLIAREKVYGLLAALYGMAKARRLI